jgi:hypothetical protein
MFMQHVCPGCVLFAGLFHVSYLVHPASDVLAMKARDDDNDKLASLIRCSCHVVEFA